VSVFVCVCVCVCVCVGACCERMQDAVAPAVVCFYCERDPHS
jgi:hypothetical protein